MHNYTTTPEQRLKELQRELEAKKKGYPAMIQQKLIAESTAGFRIRCLTDSIEDLKKIFQPTLNL